MTSRVVSARLQFALVDRSAKSSTLICAYALTYAANRTVKDNSLMISKMLCMTFYHLTVVLYWAISTHTSVQDNGAVRGPMCESLTGVTT